MSNVLLQLQYVLSEDRTMEFQVSKHVYSIVFLQYKADRLTKMQVKTVIDLNFYMNTFSNLYLYFMAVLYYLKTNFVGIYIVENLNM